MLFVVLATIGVLAVAGFLVWIWRRRRRGEAAVAGPFPIVLVHGFLGFDEVAVLGRRLQYFRGVVEALVAEGTDVHVVRLPPVASVRERALALTAYVEQLEAPRVNIVAHSMGGIDARYAIAELGLATRVAALVTIGTPHHGTPLARAGRSLPARALRRVLESAGVSSSATDWLTPEQMQQFNARVGDAPQVYYASVVGRPGTAQTVLPLRTARRFLDRRAGTSDGVVPATSQVWGELLFEVPADHWAQIGWSPSFDARPLYRNIVQHLRARGL